jgi:hypothetical protein
MRFDPFSALLHFQPASIEVPNVRRSLGGELNQKCLAPRGIFG